MHNVPKLVLNTLEILLHLLQDLWLFKRQPHKMVKHTQTIRRSFADELFECV